MASYKETFKELKKRKQGALVAFAVIGDPDYKTSLEIVKKIIDSGTGILELGIPFSDPIADGPTIQAADIRALKNGMNTDKAFDFLSEIRNYNKKIPIGLLVYGNLILQRGIGKFYSDAAKSGVNSVLAADVPIEEADDYIKAAKDNKVDTVFIISPLTSDERIKKISEKTTGFVYVAGRLGVTGARSTLEESTLTLIKKITKITNKPLCVGFGISKPEHVKAVIKAGADGAIVGSAIVSLIEKNANNKSKMLEKIGHYLKSMKKATAN
ncbi:MAG: tryptophan synthase subunit alpha [Nanoarchaeota archaeon]